MVQHFYAMNYIMLYILLIFLQMWKHHECPYHCWRNKRKEKCYTNYQKLVSILSNFLSLLLVSSVRVAWLAMKPQPVELWKSKFVQVRLRYSTGKYKQRGLPVISCHVWYIPALLTGWLLVMSSIILFALKHSTMNEGKVVC